MSTLDQIIQQLRNADHPELPSGHPVADGKHHRYGPRKKYWYQLREVVSKGAVIGYTGTFGHFSGDDPGTERFQWNGAPLSEEALAETRRRQEAAEQAEAERAARAARMAANRACDQWARASEQGASAYLERKQVTAEGVRFDSDGTIFVPMYQYDDEARLVGLQKITPEGAKRFNKGMEKKGAACRLGEVKADDQLVMIAEGYATGRSVRMATAEAFALCVCFDAGGILSTARHLRDAHPNAHVLICADDDWKIEQRMRDWLAEEFDFRGELPFDAAPIRIEAKKTWYMVAAHRCVDGNGVAYVEVTYGNDVLPQRRKRFENAGLKRAYEAAAEVDGVSVVYPTFADRAERKLTDFNDLHVEEGLEAVTRQVQAAILSILAPANDDVRPAAVDVERPTPAATSAAAGQAEWDGREAENGAHTWEQDLARSDKGTLLPTLGNVHLILSNHKAWRGVIEQDDFGGRVMKRKAPPFPQGTIGEWTDMDDQRCVLWLSQRYGISVRTDIVMNAVLLVADATHFHDVREYLEGLEWDGVPRVRSMPSTYLRVTDSEYVQLAFMKWMIAAVARVMQPGCKVDNVLILEGKQGARKSTALKVLAGGQWFTDTPIQIGNKDTYAVMAGKWVIELAELDSLNKADSSAVKSFFATAVDRFRNFYGKRATDVPRQCVFAGSVNFDTYLKDESGNRRYWPLRVGGLIDIDGIARVRDQLWAEAVLLYRAGVVWHVTEQERPLFEVEQAERYEGDVYEDKIAKALEYVSHTTMESILADILKLDTSKWTLAEQRRIGKALKSLGWVRKRESTGSRGWYYVREEQEPEAALEAVAAGDDDSPL
ncbi:virulence protein E [Burkholderia thailandensis]|uniref:Virulence-associated E family protein n=2 Tax=Burkholderia thailandensis TaxID=57975 RepID=A0AAW9D0N4_BURTH|nr:VapE domain-containing protein [Burkholderia thailandensis]MCS3394166.1 virulence protein E [Burkholderia thailandensis]MCS6427434.1 virulence protein E [Burkholderia thailandensis]MCS6455636.1 virulence protein E [Burkholderia thailandensis]MCS6466599.1 virulence protein E [Burkholderia thailandensis]MCS6485250.1 virulence protein E [Burkholderia thailandensis]